MILGRARLCVKKKARKIWQPKWVKTSSPKIRFKRVNIKVESPTPMVRARVGEEVSGTSSVMATEEGGVEVKDVLGSFQLGASGFSVVDSEGGNSGAEGIETDRDDWESTDGLRNNLDVVKMGLVDDCAKAALHVSPL